MNPNVTIRPWLLACGEQYGITQVHEYRWPDADTRPREPYITYQSIDGVPAQVGFENLSSADESYTLTTKGARDHVQRWRIDLYRSQDGLYELESFPIAADQCQSIKTVFATGGCAFVGSENVINLTTFDQEKIDYHFQLIVSFREFVEIGITEVNEAVNKIDLGIEDGSGSFEITRTGITVKPES